MAGVGLTSGTYAPAGSLDAKLYGAKGDGITDDAAAFGRLAAALATMPSDVYFPAGTYLTSVGLPALPAGVRVRGAGQMLTTIKAKAGASFTMFGTADNNTQRYGITLSDMSIDGNAANVTGTADLLDFPGACDLTVTGLRLTNPRGRALRWRGATGGALAIYGVFRDLKIRGDQAYSGGDGLVLDSGSSDGNVSQVDIGYFPYGTGGLVMSGHFGGTIAQVNAWQCMNGFNLYRVRRLRISDCLADFSLRYGYLLDGCQDVQIVNCTSRESSQAAQYYDGFYMTGDTGANKCMDVSLLGCRSAGTGLTAAGGQKAYGQNWGVSASATTVIDGVTLNGGSYRNNDSGAFNAALLGGSNVKVRGVIGAVDAG